MERRAWDGSPGYGYALEVAGRALRRRMIFEKGTVTRKGEQLCQVVLT